MPLATSRERQGRLAFMIRAQGAKAAGIRRPPLATGDDTALKRLPNDLWAAVLPAEDGEAKRYQYLVDGKLVGEPRQYEAYRMPPEMVADPGVAKGEVREMPPHASEIYPGTTRPWWVYLPATFGKAPVPAGGYNLIVFQDGQWARNWASICLDNMIAKGTLPPTVAVFVKPGSHEGKDGDNRAREYDVMSDDYVRMLLDEILPKVTAIAPLTTDPNRRLIAGQSSGGICAFTAAWERPESFGLVMSWIGSYVNIAALFEKPGGQNYPAQVRRAERKPIRVVLQDGAQDLDNEWGNWPLANQTMLAALKYKGYDVKWSFGNGFHSDAQGRAEMPDSVAWLFRTGPYAPK
ncbi:esterase family protein [bacterium]|nr:MAG: esterase family protein [bacterium]